MNKRIAFAAAVAAIAVSGCGGSSFHAPANALCKQYTAQPSGAVQQPALRTSPHAINEALASLATGYRKLAALKPPAGQAAAYAGFLADLQQKITLTTQLRYAARANNRKAITAIAKASSSITAREHTVARQLGLNRCA